MKQAEDFHSSSSGEVTNGDSGHGSDDDFTFIEGSSQSPHSLKLLSESRHHRGPGQPHHSVVSFAKQNHGLSAGHIHKANGIPTDRGVSGCDRTNRMCSPSVAGNMQNVPSGNNHKVPVKTNKQSSYRQYLRSSSNPSNSHDLARPSYNPSMSKSLNVSSSHHVPSVDSSVTFTSRPMSRAELSSRGQPYCAAGQTPAGSDDETTTSGSYSVTLDDINTDLHDVGVTKTTDAYV